MAIKDFMHALFKEEVEEDTEETVAAASQEPPTTVVTQTEFEEIRAAEPVREEPVQHYIQPEPEPVPEPEKPRTSIFSGLNLEEVQRPAKGESRQKASYKFDRSKLSKVNVTEDYQAVISPIFGNIEDEDKEYEKVHNAVELPRPEEGFSMTTVISPMFGNDLPEAKPVERIPDYKKREERKPAPVKDLLDTSRTEGYDPDPLLPVEEDAR